MDAAAALTPEPRAESRHVHRAGAGIARSGWTALAAFAVLSTAVTWPLARGLGRDVPGDYGDPLHAAWAMAWVSRQIERFLTGHLDGLTHFWQGNQLYPEPTALALSDHFIGQALPLLPFYWATHNALLLLGLAYLVAYTLAGWSAWLLTREVTGSSAAGYLAGVTFAFNPNFLVYELVHLQVVSAWPMPLVIYGLRRYFAHGERRGLWIAGASMVMLGLSSGYYLVMFPLFVVLYVAWELTARRRWTNITTWRHLLLTGVGVAAAMAPVLWPYVQARRRLGFERSVEETTRMAVNVDGYMLAVGPMIVPFTAATLAIVAALVLRASRARRGPADGVVDGAAQPLFLFTIVGAVLAFWLSLGPVPAWGSETYPSLGLYRVLQDYMPGMSVLRVSSRFSIVFTLFLAVLAGMGAARFVRGTASAIVVVLLAVASTALNRPTPFPLNKEDLPTQDVLSPAGYLRPTGSAPAVYRYLASLPPGTVVAELPFTDLWHNTRYLYFSTFHWHPLLNGFTSFFPPDYIERVRWLINPVRTPTEAWHVLVTSGVTHVVIHRAAWFTEQAPALEAWLTSNGARLHGVFDRAAVYEIGPPAGAQSAKAGGPVIP
ncbi:MAG: hypothetical protein IT178_07195 [Acidobacteria bacterium]|nr:hypothetical protein [Acidobacteriota bacterium]